LIPAVNVLLQSPLNDHRPHINDKAIDFYIISPKNASLAFALKQCNRLEKTSFRSAIFASKTPEFEAKRQRKSAIGKKIRL
jgi:hypothetical protein